MHIGFHFFADWDWWIERERIVRSRRRVGRVVDFIMVLVLMAFAFCCVLKKGGEEEAGVGGWVERNYLTLCNQR